MFKIEGNKIVINNKNDFNPMHILECGQVFSYKKQNDRYVVYSAGLKAEIIETQNGFEITTNNVDYFINYFDLNTNYSDVKKNLLYNHKFLEDAVNFGYGIRILKQDIFETIISFIVSANNNIKRITQILFGIRQKFGKKVDDYYAFPTLKELLMGTVQDFKDLGAGYRAEYIYDTCRQLINVDYNKWANLSTDDVKEQLLKLKGVGPKVADCILLFAFARQDVFPVDTWIEKVYNCYFQKESNRKTIRENLVDSFKEYSGYAQQYLFYYQRSGKI